MKKPVLIATYLRPAENGEGLIPSQFALTGGPSDGGQHADPVDEMGRCRRIAEEVGRSGFWKDTFTRIPPAMLIRLAIVDMGDS